MVPVEKFYAHFDPYVKDLTAAGIGYGTLVIMSLLAFSLVGVIGLYRVLVGIARGLPVSYWRPGQANEPGFYRRLMRCHANLFENVGLYAVVVLAAVHFPEAVPLQVFKMICINLLVGRFAQTLVYLISEDSLFVLIRFTFFALQMFSITYLGYLVLVYLLTGTSGCTLHF